MNYRIVHGLTLAPRPPPPPGLPPFSNSHSRSTRSYSINWNRLSLTPRLNTPAIRLYKPHVESAVISCHLPGYLTGCQIPGYLMENTRVFVNTPVMWHHKTGVLKNTRVFFVKYPGIFQYPGNMTLHRGRLQHEAWCNIVSHIEESALESDCKSDFPMDGLHHFLMHLHAKTVLLHYSSRGWNIEKKNVFLSLFYSRLVKFVKSETFNHVCAWLCLRKASFAYPGGRRTTIQG